MLKENLKNYEIRTTSFLHGNFSFDGIKWSHNDRFTKYPPVEGSCEVKRNGLDLFRGDWTKFLATMDMTPGDFKTW